MTRVLAGRARNLRSVMGRKRIDIVQEFIKIRDLPYWIPLTLAEPDECCTGKAKMLFEILKQGGYSVRYRVCKTRWSDLNFPPEIIAIPHGDESSHTYLEICIDGNWKIVDATWDSKLRKTFTINDWDGESDNVAAFPIREILSPEKSEDYIQHILTSDAIVADLKVNREFYRAVNEWLEKKRE